MAKIESRSKLTKIERVSKDEKGSSILPMGVAYGTFEDEKKGIKGAFTVAGSGVWVKFEGDDPMTYYRITVESIIEACVGAREDWDG